MNVRIRLMQDNEVHHVNEVYNNAYGNIRPDPYFNWEFQNGPFGKAIYVIAEDLDLEGNKIIGTQSAIPIEFINGNGVIIKTAKSEDTFVHPNYRGHKLFDRMYDILFDECTKKGIKYIWGFTYARKPFEKIGFEIPFESIQGMAVKSFMKSYKIISNLNPKNKPIDKLKIYFLCLCSYFILSFYTSFKKKLINIFEYFDFHSFEELVKRIIIKNNLWTINYTGEYLKWRLMDNPYNKNNFSEIVLVDDGITMASVIINQTSDELIYMEEILFDDKLSKNNRINFIKSVIHYLKEKKKFSLIRYWGFRTNFSNYESMEILKKSGFIFVNKGTSFVWKKLDVQKDELIIPENVLMSRLYTQGNR